MAANATVVSTGATLRTRVWLISAPLAAATRTLFSGPGSAQLAISHLILLHQITRASVPLMEAALRASRARPDDDVCVALAPYLECHIQEEYFHDQWILEDLESIGIHRAQMLSAIPSQYVAALVGAQYYWVLHHHPVALIGYMVMLEANAATEEQVGHLKAETGLPNSFFRTHLVHAELDPDHQAGILELVDHLPLSPAQDRLIAVSAMHTAECMVDCLANLAPDLLRV